MGLVAVDSLAPDASATSANCLALEHGSILLVRQTPLAWTDDDRTLLDRVDHSAGAHKNIAFDIHTNRLTGVGRDAGEIAEALRRLMRSYAEQITALANALLGPYAAHWRVDHTSFRPQEEEGRALPWRARNDLLHIDAFPSRPTNGARILRVFTNVHPTRTRRWVTGEPFDALVGRIVGQGSASLPLPRRRASWSALRRLLARRAPAALAPILRRSPYDAFMLRLHDHLKADAQFQATAPKQLWEFPPGSSWIVFTDCVPHAALSGRCALEQTYLVPRTALLHPERAPASILERLAGMTLTDR